MILVYQKVRAIVKLRRVVSRVALRLLSGVWKGLDSQLKKCLSSPNNTEQNTNIHSYTQTHKNHYFVCNSVQKCVNIFRPPLRRSKLYSHTLFYKGFRGFLIKITSYNIHPSICNNRHECSYGSSDIQW